MRAKRRSSGAAPEKTTQAESEKLVESGSSDELDLYEDFDLGGLTKEEALEINKVAPPGQRLEDVMDEDPAIEEPKILYNQLRETSARIDEAFQQTFRKWRRIKPLVLC